MNFCVLYTPPVSSAVYGGKKPCRLANEVEFAVLSMTEIRSQSACWFLLVLKMARSEPPAKTGAAVGPFSLGVGNEAQLALSVEWAGRVAVGHGPSMYRSSLPRPKSVFAPPAVEPVLPSSVCPTYFDGDRWSLV